MVFRETENCQPQLYENTHCHCDLCHTEHETLLRAKDGAGQMISFSHDIACVKKLHSKSHKGLLVRHFDD